MARGFHSKLTAQEIEQVWVRLKAGHPVKDTARRWGSPRARCACIHRAAVGSGRRRGAEGPGRLSLGEREEASRGLASGCRCR